MRLLEDDPDVAQELLALREAVVGRALADRDGRRPGDTRPGRAGGLAQGQERLPDVGGAVGQLVGEVVVVEGLEADALDGRLDPRGDAPIPRRRAAAAAPA